MNFFDLIENLKADTLGVSLPGFKPELTLCATIVAMLLARLPRWGAKINAMWIALAGTLVALYFAAPWHYLAQGAEPVRQPIFHGLLIYDSLTIYFRSLLLVFAALFLVFTWLSGIPDREDSPDVYTLVLGATIGMCLMASSNNLFMVFLGVEMASVPSYALAGVLKGRRASSEAALKYSVYGAGTAGVMLYGISLLAGAVGTFHLPTMAQIIAQMPADALAERSAVLLSGGLMLMVGLAFKLSAVPFHFWCPDVFEGAPAEVNAFLSVASKAAALALLVRVAVGISAADEQPVAAVNQPVQVVAYHTAAAEHAAPAKSGKTENPAAGETNLGRVRHYAVGLISLLAAITCTFGNLTAYAQTNIKRLLAYSTIAHAGYMMMPVAAAVALVDRDPALAREAIAGLCFYAGVYLFMNLGAFAIVAFLRNAMQTEEIADYAGLVRSQPGVVICLSAILLSLLGLPPLAGFAAKFAIFRVLVTDPQLYLLLVIGGLNTVLSLIYYVRVVKVMTLDPEPADRVPVEFSLLSPAGVYVVAVTIPVVVLGIWFDPLGRLAQAAAASL